jgi:hypothetical protein
MANCDVLISLDVQQNCTDRIVAGIEPNGVIINRQDVDMDNVEFDAARKNVISALPIKTGKRGYSIYVPSNTPFNGTQTAFAAGTNRNTFTNDLAFAIMANDPDVCEKVIDGLANGEFVVVYENKYKNLNKESTPGDSAFQVVGLRQGLKATTLENNKYSEDTEGGWNVVLQETKAPESALFLYAQTLAATRTLFNGLTQIPA